MTRSARHLINAGIFVLVVAHAVYRFATRPEVASELWLGLVIAEGIVGLFGAVWFLLRARGASV